MHPIAYKISRRLNWYKARFQVNNPTVGRAVELLGNKVRMDGLIYSVNTPQLTRGHKSTLAFGLHEMEERELIRRWLPPDIPVIEFGGGLGVVSCLTNSKLHDPFRHVVVEANPTMASVLERNRDLNGCKFRVINKAIAYDCDHVSLNLDSEFVGSTIKRSGDNTVIVHTTTISDIMTSENFDHAGIVCDIEGAEIDVVQREFGVLGERLCFVIMETHPKIVGKDSVAKMLQSLTSFGFIQKQQIGDSVFLSR